jgi:hypothetical protein
MTTGRMSFPFPGDPSLLRPASKDFRCYEILQVQASHKIDYLDRDDNDESFSCGQKVMFNCSLPQENESLVFSCLEPSCGVLMENESAAEMEEDGQMDPFFFDQGYTLAGKTGFQVCSGSRLLVESLIFCDKKNDFRPLLELQE